jgi:hypothetical protein
VRTPKTPGDADRKNIVGERVRKARLQHAPPLTQDELSGRLARLEIALDRVAITKIENGGRAVFDFEVKAFATVLKVEIGWLLGMRGAAQNKKLIK